MTGVEFAVAGQALALAYARLRPGGAEWLAAWQADDEVAADELHEWELEGHPFTGLPLAAPPASNDALRIRIGRVVDQLLVILDRLDCNPDLEDGGDAEPSLGAPENHHASQIGWMRGSDSDREAA